MDVIKDMFNPDLSITTLEYDQWGDRIKKNIMTICCHGRPTIMSKKHKLPGHILYGGLNDTQVPYYSPAKWVARVRENNTGNM
jgi:oligopeptidase B